MKIEVVFDLIDKATRPLRNIDTNMGGVTRTLNKLQGCMWKLNQTSELFGRMGDTISQLSQPFREFEQGMADLSALTGLAGSDLKRLGEVARKSGVESGLGAVGATEAFKLLASQIQVDDIGLEGLIALQKETITLSQAAGMSMSDAANAMAGTINQFGLQASEANRVINVLAAGSKYGAAEIPDLAMSFKVVGAAANAAGLNIESTAGAIEVLSKNNLKGSEAGTALRNILLKMQTEMGVDFNKTSLSEALTKLKPKYKDAAYMSKLFGMENMAAAQFLVANADQVDEMTRKVTDTQTASEQAAISTDTWNHRLKVQAAQFNEWSMQLTESAPGIMNFIQLAAQGATVLTSLSPLLAGGWGLLKGTIGLFGGVAGGVGSVIKATRMLNAAQSAGRLSTYADLIKRYGVAGRIAAAGIWLKNGAVAAWNGICTAANALTSRAWWLTMRHAIATRASAIWTGLCSKAQLVGSSVMSLWSKRTLIASAIQGGLTKALRTAKLAIVGGMLPALGGAIAATWAWTAALLANPITWIVLGIGALIAAVVVCWQQFAGFRAVVLTIWDTVKGFGEAVFNYLVAPFKAAYEMVAGVAKAIGTLFKGGSLKDAGKEVTEGFKNGVEAGVGSVRKAVTGVRDTAAGISGNYQMHLTQEQAKQQQKEQAKKEKEAQRGMAPSGEITPGLPTVPEGGLTPEYDLSGMQTAQSPTSASAQPATSRPQITGPYQGLDPLPQQMPTMPAAPGRDDFGRLPGAGSAPSVSINYNPSINISGDMTQKGRDDLMKVLRDNVSDVARMIKEELRRSERGSYGLS